MSSPETQAAWGACVNAGAHAMFKHRHGIRDNWGALHQDRRDYFLTATAAVLRAALVAVPHGNLVAVADSLRTKDAIT